MGKDYKDTLLLPKTDFPMRGNLGKKEPEMQAHWNEINLLEKVNKRNEGKEPFYLHDGPPYANGDIHAGTALNKVLKDFIIRYKNMTANRVIYQPGWDTHGLPIEVAVAKSGINRKEMSIIDFRKKCEAFALSQVERQKAEFVRLGVLADWDNPYLTLQKDYEARQIRLFSKMVERGLIYRGQKPVYWSTSSESALAEAEIEYYDVKSDSIYVAFPLVEKFDGKDVSLIIWTTTPWTLPANLAIAVHPRLEYALIDNKGKHYIIGKSRLEPLKEALGLEEAKILRTFNGQELENLLYFHPLMKRESPVILGDHVSDEDGTGLVHTAPGHGTDDYVVGMKYHLDILSPVNEYGVFTEEAGEFAGMYYEKANPVIIERLKEEGLLLYHTTFTHSYPHDWRTRKPVIFRATPQWFASIEDIKEGILKTINEDVVWKPAWGRIRLYNMIEDRGDWCISRQRYWGVPIPIFYAENGDAIMEPEIINHVADLFEEKGSNVWYELEAKELLPDGYTHPGSPNGKFEKELDTMDVWFDSGTSFLTLDGNKSEIYLEGSDQYRGWFNSSLINSYAYSNQAPYKMVISHGFVLDKRGRKMSKSLGNVIDPNKVAKQYGADVFRIWAASVNYESDVPLSDEILRQASEGYRKIRNTFRYILGNLRDFDPETDHIAYSMRDKLSQVMTVKLFNLQNQVIDGYENYEFEKIYRAIMPFIINDLSAFYLDYIKDILYILKEDAYERRSVQSTLYDILLSLLKMLAPIIPHTASEAYSYLPGTKYEDIYLERMPRKNEFNVHPELLPAFELFSEVRDEVLRKIENARNEKILSKTLQADLKIWMPKRYMDAIFDVLNINLVQVLMVSHIEVFEGDEIKVEVSLSNGKTCARCWNVVDEINEDELCPRCQNILNN